MGQLVSCVRTEQELKPKRNITKALIGSPTNFQHLAHGGSDGMVMNYGSTNSQLKSLKKDMEEFAKLLDDIDIVPKSLSSKSLALSKKETSRDRNSLLDQSSESKLEAQFHSAEALDQSLAEIFNLVTPPSLHEQDIQDVLLAQNGNFLIQNDVQEEQSNEQDKAGSVSEPKKKEEGKIQFTPEMNEQENSNLALVTKEQYISVNQ